MNRKQTSATLLAWIRMGLAGLASIAAALLMPCAMVRANPAPPTFQERPCDIDVSSPEVAARLRCGTVRVPRDPAQPQAGHVDLAVVVKRSAAPVAGAAPLLILHGGPGGEQVRYMGRGTRDFVAGRDSIAFDMRGGGRTGPALCRGTLSALMATGPTALAGQDPAPARTEALNACWSELRAAGFRPEHFGTERQVGDAEAVRQALGIARWSVYGMSYGTTVAADYLARHPQSIESVVLDSLYPPDAFVPTVREAQGRAIARMLDECAADAACAARFPKLSSAQAEADLAGLNAQPLAFQYEGRQYAADELWVRSALRGLFYNESLARTVPLFFDALRRRDGETLAAVLGLPLVMGRLPDNAGFSVAGLMATDCRDRPRHHAVDPNVGPSWMAMFLGVQSGACGTWALGTPPTLPEGTNVPVLVLSAGYDPFQPDGAAVAKAIGPAATAITVARAAHVVRGAGECPRGLIERFIAQPTQPLDTGCLATMSAPDFLLDVAPRPRLVASAARSQAGQAPWGIILAGMGGMVWALAGAVAPVVVWVWRRRRGAAAVQASRLPWTALGLGALAWAGLAIPVLATFSASPGAAAFGVAGAWAPLLWAVPLAGLWGAAVAVAAARQRRWSSALAGLGLVMMAAGAWAAGAWPWA